MATPRWCIAASVLLAVVGTTAGVISLAGRVTAPLPRQSDANAKGGRKIDSTFFEVKPGRLDVAVDEMGLLEATRRDDVFCQVEGQATIISLVPDGTRVSKGQLVCELDSAALKDQLTIQYIATSGAEAAYQNAKLSREYAETNLGEYNERLYQEESLAINAEIAAAQTALRETEAQHGLMLRARKRLDDLLAKKGEDWGAAEIVADLHVSDRLVAVTRDLAQTKRTLEQAKAKQGVHEKSTRDKMLQEFRSDIAKARSKELADQQTWELAKRQQVKLDRQIQNCKLMAPIDGVLNYANDRVLPDAVTPARIEEGATVRGRQKIFTIADLGSPMRVIVKVPESVIEWVSPGLPARIKAEASGDESIPGVVEAVSPLPDPAMFANQAVKVYTTYVSIAKGHAGLVPGDVAEVQIVTKPLEDMLCVPVRSAVYYDRADHVAVKEPDGAFVWRSVVLGRSDGTMVEVKDGLKAGEVVSLEPTSSLTQVQKFKISVSPPRPAPKPHVFARPRRQGKGETRPGPSR